jgi:hypothetical protein
MAFLLEIEDVLGYLYMIDVWKNLRPIAGKLLPTQFIHNPIAFGHAKRYNSRDNLCDSS